MKLSAVAFVILPACLFAQPSSAQTVDPLWSKTLEHAAQVKTWVPENKDASAAFTRDGIPQTSNTRSRLQGWEKGNPVYDTVQVDPKPEAGASAAAKKKGDMPDVAVIADALMQSSAPVRRTDKQSLHGKSWTLFEIADSYGPGEMKIRLWVDPQTGVAHQMESKMVAPLLFDTFMTTEYAPHPLAGSLPQRMDVTVKRLVPFRKSSIHIVITMDNWIRRPN